MEKYYAELADQIVSNIEEGRAAMAHARTRAKERGKELAESLADARGMLEQFAEDDQKRATDIRQVLSAARKEGVAETGRMMADYRNESAARAKSFKQVLATARAARQGRETHGKDATTESKKKTASSNGRRKKAKR